MGYIVKIFKHINGSFNGNETDITQTLTGLSPEDLSKYCRITEIDKDNYEGTSFFKQSARKAKIEFKMYNNNLVSLYNMFYFPVNAPLEYADINCYIYYSKGIDTDDDGEEDENVGEIITYNQWVEEGSIEDNRDEIFSDISKLAIKIFNNERLVYTGLVNKAETSPSGDTFTIVLVDALFILSQMADKLFPTNFNSSGIDIVNKPDETENRLVSIESTINSAINMLHNSVGLNININYSAINENTTNVLSADISGTIILPDCGDITVISDGSTLSSNLNLLSPILIPENFITNTDYCFYWFPFTNQSLAMPKRTSLNNSIPAINNIIYRYIDRVIYKAKISMNIKNTGTNSYLYLLTSTVYRCRYTDNNELLGETEVSSNWEAIEYGIINIQVLDNIENSIKTIISNDIKNYFMNNVYSSADGVTIKRTYYNQPGFIYESGQDKFVILVKTTLTYNDIITDESTVASITNFNSNLSVDIFTIEFCFYTPLTTKISEIIKTYLFLGNYALVTSDSLNIMLIDRYPFTSTAIGNTLIAVTKNFTKIQLDEDKEIITSIKDTITCGSVSEYTAMNKQIGSISAKLLANKFRTKINAEVVIIDSSRNIVPFQTAIDNIIEIGTVRNIEIKLTAMSSFITYKVYIIGVTVKNKTQEISGIIVE